MPDSFEHLGNRTTICTPYLKQIFLPPDHLEHGDSFVIGRIMDVYLLTGRWGFTGADFYQRSAVVRKTLKQNLDLATACLAAKQTRRNNPRIVENQAITRLQQRRKVREISMSIGGLIGGFIAIEHQQATARAVRARKLCNQLIRYLYMEISSLHWKSDHERIVTRMALPPNKNSLHYSSSPAGVAELVDAPDSKSGSGNRVRVQVSLPAPYKPTIHALKIP